MGLDMYLEIRKNEYRSKYHKDKGSRLKLEYPKDITEFIPNLTDLTISRKTNYEVGYWRKANHIHNQFIQNCADRDECGDPIDDCRPIEITVDKLEELLETCKKVSADHSLASSLLPTQRGFFFGSTEYDEYYFKDIEDTIEIIEPVLKFAKHKLEIKDYAWEVYYQASWQKLLKHVKLRCAFSFINVIIYM